MVFKSFVGPFQSCRGGVAVPVAAAAVVVAVLVAVAVGDPDFPRLTICAK